MRALSSRCNALSGVVFSVDAVIHVLGKRVSLGSASCAAIIDCHYLALIELHPIKQLVDHGIALIARSNDIAIQQTDRLARSHGDLIDRRIAHSGSHLGGLDLLHSSAHCAQIVGHAGLVAEAQ